MIVINNQKAIEVAKDKIRAIREPMLKKLDVDFQIALEQGLNTTEIVKEKQRLRDLTDIVNNKTIDDMLIILNELGVK